MSKEKLVEGMKILVLNTRAAGYPANRISVILMNFIIRLHKEGVEAETLAKALHEVNAWIRMTGFRFQD